MMSHFHGRIRHCGIIKKKSRNCWPLPHHPVLSRVATALIIGVLPTERKKDRACEAVIIPSGMRLTEWVSIQFVCYLWAIPISLHWDKLYCQPSNYFMSLIWDNNLVNAFYEVTPVKRVPGLILQHAFTNMVQLSQYCRQSVAVPRFTITVPLLFPGCVRNVRPHGRLLRTLD